MERTERLTLSCMILTVTGKKKKGEEEVKMDTKAFRGKVLVWLTEYQWKRNHMGPEHRCGKEVGTR